MANIDVALIWATYFLIVFVVYLVFSNPAVGWAISPYIALFIGFIVGLIYVLLWWFLFNRNDWSTKQKNGMIALIIVAAVLLILDLLFVLWGAMRACRDPCAPKCPPKECDPCEEEEEPVYVKKKVMCDAKGENCHTKKVVAKSARGKYEVLYADE